MVLQITQFKENDIEFMDFYVCVNVCFLYEYITKFCVIEHGYSIIAL